MYHDDCLVFCAKGSSLGESVESVSGATELDDRARYYWVIVTRMTGAACILLLSLHRLFSRPDTVLPVDSARSCPREYIIVRRPPLSTR